MKIIRFGKEIELTDEELKRAHEEYQNKLDTSDVRAYVGNNGNSEEDDKHGNMQCF